MIHVLEGDRKCILSCKRNFLPLKKKKKMYKYVGSDIFFLRDHKYALKLRHRKDAVGYSQVEDKANILDHYCSLRIGGVCVQVCI